MSGGVDYLVFQQMDTAVPRKSEFEAVCERCSKATGDSSGTNTSSSDAKDSTGTLEVTLRFFVDETLSPSDDPYGAK